MNRSTLWRVVLVLAVVASVLGIVFNPAWEPRPEAPNDNPPYTAPPVAELLPEDEAVSAAMQTTMVRTQDSPPSSRIYELDTAMARDYRESAIDQAWERRWESYGELEQVLVVAEITTASSLSPARAVCAPQEELDVPGASTAGVVGSSETVTGVCASIDVGRQHLMVELATVDGDHAARADAALRALVAPLAQEIEPVDDPEWAGTLQRSRTQILRVELVAFLLVLAAAIVPGLVSQIPKAGRRLLGRLSADEQNPEHVDVEGERRFQTLQTLALGAVRVALLVWALRLTFTVPALASTLMTALTLLTAYLVGVWLQRRLSTDPRNRRRPRLLRGTAALPSALGVVGSVLLLTGAFAVWMVGNRVTGGSSGGAEVATWQIRGFGLLLQAVAVVLFLWVLAPVMLGRRVSMAMMRDRPPSCGPPVLMLRTFGDDRLRMRVARRDRVGFLDSLVMKRRERFEEVITYTLARYGPLTAIGQPGQRLPPGLGGQRLTFSHDTWQDGVRHLADDARLIVLTVGKTQGLSWEMNHVASEGLLHRTIFVVPPVGVIERQERLELLAASYGLDPEVFDTGTLGRLVLAFCWPLGWARPMVIVSGSADDISYDIALERCAEALLAETPPPPEQATSEPALPTYRDLGLPPGPPRIGSAARLWPKIVAWNVAISSIVVPLGGALLVGDPFGSDERLTEILVFPEGAEVQVLGGPLEESYALVNAQFLVRGDFADSTWETVAELETLTFAAARHDDRFVYLGAGLNGHPPTVGTVDVGTGEELWSVDMPQRASSLAVSDLFVAVPHPAEPQLQLWDLATGDPDEPVELPCRPWDVIARGDSFWVSCPAEGQLLEIVGSAVRSRYDVPLGATSLLPAMEVPYVQVARDSVVIDPLDQDFRLWTRVARPHLSAVDGYLAAEGVDRVSILSGTGIARRNTMVPMSSLAVEQDGTVQYSTGHRWILLLPGEE